MRVERAPRQADIRRMMLAIAAHQLAAPADHAHRQATAERLAVGHHVGAHAEVFLCAAGGQAKTHEHFIEDEDDAALGADGAQLA